MQTSELFSIDIKDAAKGLVVAIGGALFSSIYTVVESGTQTGHFALNWHVIGISALGAGLSYIGKQYFTVATIVTPANQTQNNG